MSMLDMLSPAGASTSRFRAVDEFHRPSADTVRETVTGQGSMTFVRYE